MLTGWIEIKARGKSAARDEAASLLIKAGSPGVLEEERPALVVNTLLSHSTWEADAFPEETRPAAKTATLTAYLRAQDGLKNIEKELKKIGWSFTASPYKDKDWSIKWKAGIKPVRVGFKNGDLIVKPPWRKAGKRPGDVVVNIDPGMAFGTGSHQTTRMCLKAIAALLTSGKFLPRSSRLLDVGTGSGVLAIAAKKLRVKKAAGIDIDPVALKAARKNARLNKADIIISAKPVEDIKGLFSIIAANILAGDLKRLSKALKDKTAPGGALILSGILREEADSVSDVFTGIGLKPYKRYNQGEWAALVFVRPL